MSKCSNCKGKGEFIVPVNPELFDKLFDRYDSVIPCHERCYERAIEESGGAKSEICKACNGTGSITN